MICPICHRERDDSMPLLKAKEVINLIGLEEEFCNPGGRQIKLKGYCTLQLSDQCNWCDCLKILKHILGGHKKEHKKAKGGEDETAAPGKP